MEEDEKKEVGGERGEGCRKTDQDTERIGDWTKISLMVRDSGVRLCLQDELNFPSK